ncbi:hypothetical protein [Lysobacter xanthus]
MKNVLALILATGAATAYAGTPQQNASCVANPPLHSLSPHDRAAVTEVLAFHSKHLCSTDACEFRLHELAEGKTLISLRAARYSEELSGCVTVYMGRAAVVVDRSGRVADMWSYCQIAAEEAKRDPAIKREMGYHWCESQR